MIEKSKECELAISRVKKIEDELIEIGNVNESIRDIIELND